MAIRANSPVETGLLGCFIGDGPAPVRSELCKDHEEQQSCAGTRCDGLPFHQGCHSHGVFPKAGGEDGRSAGESTGEIQNPRSKTLVLLGNDVVCGSEDVGGEHSSEEAECRRG